MNVTVNQPVPNTPPTANAGVDREIALPTNFLSQTGNYTLGSGTSASFLWSQLSGTTNANHLRRHHPDGQLHQTWQRGLTVSSSPLPTTWVISPRISSWCMWPGPYRAVARIGANLIITLPVNSVNLSGSTSRMLTVRIMNYLWEQTDGPATGTFGTPKCGQYDLQQPVEGTYTCSSPSRQ
jgi:hypothetical protein